MADDLGYAEISVLAGVLASNGAKLDDLILSGPDFADGRYGDIYETMRRMRSEGKPVDPTTVGGELPQHAVFMWSIGDQVPSTANTEYHAGMVREAAVRRRVLAAGTRIVEWSKDRPLAELTDVARKELDDAFGMQRRKVSYVGDTIRDTIAAIGRPTRAVPTPWRSLSSAIGGFRPGALYVVGARPGVGKTVVALQCATALAAHGSVAFASLEMPEHELQLRLLTQGSGVSHRLLEKSELLPHYAAQQVEAYLPRFPSSISVDDRGSVTVNDIRTSVRSVARDGKLAGVVVDYMQLISGVSGASRIEVVTEASRQLKLLARDFDVPVIALSQLNRNSESRADKKPAMSDLRESGAIEQDADVVILLHRDMEPRQEQDTEFMMLVAKNRHGSTGALSFEWQGEFMRVVEQ
jgi:replicative DNA helicase